MSRYTVVCLYKQANEQTNEQADEQADEQANEQANEQADEQANEQADEQANEHNKLNLTKLFNYIIYNKGRSENFCDGNLKLSYDDRLCIVRVLKSMNLYIENLNAVKLMTAKELLRYQECYYAIAVLCTNSYKSYLSKLTREVLLNKFLKVEAYCKNKTENEKMRYLIKSLQNELEVKT